jgi:hypothetical protein
VQYNPVVERSRAEIELLLHSQDSSEIAAALLSAAYYDRDWLWVQSRCLLFSYHEDPQVRSVAATCLGHLARIHGQLDLDTALERLNQMSADPLARAAAEDSLEDIGFFLKLR